MSTLEDRVRAAARAAAATVAEGSAPPLKLAQPGRRQGPRGRDGRHPWIVPLAAAAAVIALVAASIFGAHALGPGTRLPAPPSESLPRLADGLPAYFLQEASVGMGCTRASNGNVVSLPSPSRGSHVTVDVVATATGKVAATATLSGCLKAIAASRGAFFAAVANDNLARFYEIRLNESRTTATVTELPIRPGTAPLAYITVSPDGARLAYSTLAMHGASGKVQNLFVASTTDGRQREWLTPPQDSQGSMGPMTWLANGRTLAFNWTTAARPVEISDLAPADAHSGSSLRLLDTEAPGSDLMASRAVLPSVYEAGPFRNDTATGAAATLSPDGQVVVGSASGAAASHAPADSVLAFSTATGEETLLYRVSHHPYIGNGCYFPPIWISNAGSEVLIECFQGFGNTPTTTGYVVNVVLINHGHAIVLPWLRAAIQGGTLAAAFP
jgi:hypothetical protein